jgi:predicted permease
MLLILFDPYGVVFMRIFEVLPMFDPYGVVFPGSGGLGHASL